jgi:hypothetical protein
MLDDKHMKTAVVNVNLFVIKLESRPCNILTHCTSDQNADKTYKMKNIS